MPDTINAEASDEFGAIANNPDDSSDAGATDPNLPGAEEEIGRAR